MAVANPSFTQEERGQISSLLCLKQDENDMDEVSVRDSTVCCAKEKTCNGVDELKKSGSNARALVSLLAAYAKSKDLHKGHLIHIDVVKRGLLKENSHVGNALVNLYAKCGALAKAQEAFDELPVRNVCSWNVLITGYVGYGCAKEALYCFDQMRREGICSDGVTFISALKACGNVGALHKGRDIHAAIIRENWLKKDMWVVTAVMNMYAKCNALASAEEVFDKLQVKNTVVWTTLIAGYSQCGHLQQALSCFEQMQREGISPNGITYACILKVLGSIGEIDKGQELHTKIVRDDLLKNDIWLGTALVDMYVKCGALKRAQDVFNELPARSSVSWTVLITGYAQHGQGEEALSCFEQMLSKEYYPDAITFACIFKVCGRIGLVGKGREIHRSLAKYRSLEKNIMIGTALVDMYAKCGALVEAQDVFDRLQVRNAVSWTALITGYVQYGPVEEALHLFEQMQGDGVHPDAVTFACVLRACGSLGAANKGQQIHAEIARNGFLERDQIIGNELLDMYAKCGLPWKAQEVFEKVLTPDAFSWTALIAGYMQLGMMDIALELLTKMTDGGIEPNLVTFTIILNACSHLGLLEEGEMYFEIMSTKYCIAPQLEHYTCMIDLFGRAGLFGKAVLVILNMPSSDHLEAWITLLAACRKWGNVKVGRWAFEHAVQLNEKDGAAYVCMRSIYVTAGMQLNADNVKAMRVRNKAFDIGDTSFERVTNLASAFCSPIWCFMCANE